LCSEMFTIGTGPTEHHLYAAEKLFEQSGANGFSERPFAKAL
jgi:hypothetical protein